MADLNTRPQQKPTVAPSAPKAAKPEQAPVPREPGTTMVTYIPREDGDPARTEWNGHKFVANVPLAVKDAQMIAQAKGNPWFQVEGHDKDAPELNDSLPIDSDGYRRYAVAWFKEMTSSADMKARWDSEAALRESCGVGSDDLEYLDKLYVPKLAELTKAAS